MGGLIGHVTYHVTLQASERLLYLFQFVEVVILLIIISMIVNLLAITIIIKFVIIITINFDIKPHTLTLNSSAAVSSDLHVYVAIYPASKQLNNHSSKAQALLVP